MTQLDVGSDLINKLICWNKIVNFQFFQGGIQALETMLYTVDKINAENKILPNISLGVHILDDCDKDTYGLEQAVEFIKGTSVLHYQDTAHFLSASFFYK